MLLTAELVEHIADGGAGLLLTSIEAHRQEEFPKAAYAHLKEQLVHDLTEALENLRLPFVEPTTGEPVRTCRCLRFQRNGTCYHTGYKPTFRDGAA